MNRGSRALSVTSLVVISLTMVNYLTANMFFFTVPTLQIVWDMLLLLLTELHVPRDLRGHGDLGVNVHCDLGGHVPKVEVVGDHRIVSNQRVWLKLRGLWKFSFQEEILSDQTEEIFSISTNIFDEIWTWAVGAVDVVCRLSGWAVEANRLGLTWK